MFLHYLRQASEKYECPVHSLSLVPDSVELVVTPPTKRALSRFVQWVAARYGRFRNHRRDQSGRLFEERYAVLPILTEQYLAVVTAHVELNPVRIGRCGHPADWPWSTYRLHAGRADLSEVPYRLWTPSSWFLELGNEAYAKWCLARAPSPADPPREKYVRRPDGTRAT
jgi:putative transposase